MRGDVRLGLAAFTLAVGLSWEIGLAQDETDPRDERAPAQREAGGEIDETEEIDIEDLPPRAEEACFFSRDIQRFSALSDSFLLVEGRRDEYFLLTMFPGCLGLGQSIRIALLSDLNRVCSNSAPSVAYESLVSGRETCPIQMIESVEDRESAERLVELRSRQ